MGNQITENCIRLFFSKLRALPMALISSNDSQNVNLYFFIILHYLDRFNCKT